MYNGCVKVFVISSQFLLTDFSPYIFLTFPCFFIYLASFYYMLDTVDGTLLNVWVSLSSSEEY